MKKIKNDFMLQHLKKIDRKVACCCIAKAFAETFLWVVFITVMMAFLIVFS